MDVVLETLLKKKRGGSDYVLLALLAAAGVVLSIFLILMILYATAMLGEFGQIAGSVGMLFVAAVWWGIYILYNSRSIEYEYTVINSSLDIDKIMAKKRRKNMLSIDIKNAKLMACVNDEENNGIYKDIDKSVKILDLSAGNANMYTYFIDCEVDDKRCIVLFQPTSKMVEGLWRFNPKAVKKFDGNI